MIILTLDTDQLAGQGEQAHGRALGDWLAAESQAQRLTRVRPGQLPAEELVEIAVAELGPELDAAMLDRVVDHADGVPGTLYDLLEAPAVAQALGHGGDGPADLAAILPQVGVHAALAAAPVPTQQALAIASLHGRMTVREWLYAPAASPTHPNLGDVTADVVDDAIAAGWLRPRPGTPIVEFATSQVLGVVRTAQSRVLTPGAISAVRRALLSAIEDAHTDHTWDGMDQDARESLLVSVVEENPQAPPETIPASLTAELLTLRRLSGREAAKRKFLDTLTERLASGQAFPRILTVATAEALFDAGQLDKAFQVLHDEYRRLQIQYGENDARTRPALHNLAAASAAVAKASQGQPESAPLYQAAITLYEQLLEARVQTVPTDYYQVIVTRNQYAHLLADFFHYQEALTQAEKLIAEQTAFRGPDHPDTLLTRGNLGIWRGKAGDPAGAAAVFEVLLPDVLRALGPDDQSTLAARGNLALWRGTAGDPAGAAAVFEVLLADELRVLGPDHPDTLVARGNLASAYHAAGRLVVATQLQEQTLADYERVLGPYHENTLTSRANLAMTYCEGHRLPEAIALFQHTLKDCEHALPPDHPLTRSVRESLDAATRA
jgi:hypothetical protein